MQLLTASKLSTVAMLVMAAVLVYSPVSAVPMEQAGVEEVPPPKAPSLADYKSTKDGNPSEQAINDMRAIYTLEEPQAKDDDPSPVPDVAKTLFDTLPMETLVNIVDHMDWNSRKNFAQTGPRNYEAVQDRSPRFVNALVGELGELWDKYKEEKNPRSLDEDKFEKIFAVSPVWEKVVEEATDQKLIDCPYNELPYTPDERPEGQNPSEKELLRMALRSSNVFQAYVRHNVCRLAVNGAYSWILRMLTMDGYSSSDEIFSVLGQLKLFTSDRAFASDLGKVLKLFAKVGRADRRKMRIPDDLRPLLLISSPEAIPVVAHSQDDILKATLLLLAANQHPSKPVTHLNTGRKDLADIVKMGSMDEFLNNIIPTLNGLYSLLGYSSGLVDQLVQFNKSLGKTSRQAIKDLLKNPSSGFESDGKIIKLSRVYNEIRGDLKPFEVLVRLLPEDRLKTLYGQGFKSKMNPVYVIMAGMDTDKSGFMKYVFEDIFGVDGTRILGDLEIDRRRVNARDLASLARGCAVACTDENWQVFVETFVKKIKSTPELPGKVHYRPSTAAPPQEVAEHISKRVEKIESKNEKAREITPADKNPEIQVQVDKVMDKLQALATALTAPLDVPAPVEESLAKSQPSQ